MESLYETMRLKGAVNDHVEPASADNSSDGATLTDNVERIPRSADEVRQVHRRWLERRSVRLADALNGVERCVVMATAVGAALSLAIAGFIIGTDRLINLEFYVVTVVFLVGLLSSWVGRYLDVVLAVDIQRSSAIWIKLYYFRRSTFWLSAIAVVVGTLIAMMELHHFTR